MVKNLRDITPSEEFDYNFLVNILSNYKNPRVKINDLLKKGEIIRVKKGLYVFGPELARWPYSRELLANLIYGPSYISLEYALSFYGLIPEKVEVVTSVTNKRNKIFETPIGTFSYRYIHADLFPQGMALYKIDKERTILLATKEKALCDLLYFSEKMGSVEELERYLFESLRTERVELMKLRVQKIRQLAHLYGHNISLLAEMLRRSQR